MFQESKPNINRLNFAALKTAQIYFLTNNIVKEVANIEEGLTLYKEVKAISVYRFAKVIYVDAAGERYEIAN